MPADLSTLQVVRLGRPLARGVFGSFVERVGEALDTVVDDVEVSEDRDLTVDRIEARVLTAALDQRIGGHVLGVTDADLLDQDGGDDFFSFMFGGKDERNQVAVVSTHRLGSSDPDRCVDRVLKVALHEVGHNFGLMHHYAFVPAPDGGYCPMSKGDYNRYGERAYVRAVIDARGSYFCSDCHTFMRRVARASATLH